MAGERVPGRAVPLRDLRPQLVRDLRRQADTRRVTWCHFFLPTVLNSDTPDANSARAESTDGFRPGMLLDSNLGANGSSQSSGSGQSREPRIGSRARRVRNCVSQSPRSRRGEGFPCTTKRGSSEPAEAGVEGEVERGDGSKSAASSSWPAPVPQAPGYFLGSAGGAAAKGFDKSAYNAHLGKRALSRGMAGGPTASQARPATSIRRTPPRAARSPASVV